MQPILAFDAAPIHLQPSVFELLGELDIWWLLIPKKLTLLLQPLDTHTFSKYKRHVRNRWMDTLFAQEGRRNVKDIVLIVIDTIKTVLEGNSWSTAFKANGIAEDTASISKYIKDQLEWPLLPAIVAGPPALDELVSAWPLSRRVPLAEVYKSLGLDVPEVGHLPLGEAAEECFLAPAEDDDECPSDAEDFADTALPAVALSSDDEPLIAASGS